MAVPTGPLNVAWFSPGTLPGDIGSAVIAGHEGWKNNIRAVFDNLYKLQVGDKVYVQDANGATKTFTVRALRTYAQDAATSDVFTSGDGKRHLNLITCEGLWNSTQKSYPNRLVVFTVEE
jgi:sortase A